MESDWLRNWDFSCWASVARDGNSAAQRDTDFARACEQSVCVCVCACRSVARRLGMLRFVARAMAWNWNMTKVLLTLLRV